MSSYLELRGARTNNLRNIDVRIPLKKLTIVTGVSGSGKSSLVFDTLYAEGQRRYAESLSTYTRQFLDKIPRPDIDSLTNISPAIALEQKNNITNSRSTVATMSELSDYLRLLFGKIGDTFCTQCQKLVRKDTPSTISTDLMEKARAQTEEAFRFYVLAPLSSEFLTKKTWPETRKSQLANGFERALIVSSSVEVAELSSLETLPRSLKKAYVVIDRMSLDPHVDARHDQRLQDALEQALVYGNGEICIATLQWNFYTYSNRYRCDHCQIDYREPDPQLLSFNSPIGACASCSGFGFNLELSEEIIVPDPRKTLRQGAVDPFTKPAYSDYHKDLLKFCERTGISTSKRYEDLSRQEKDLLWNGDGAKKGFPGIRGVFEEFKTWKYKMHVRIFIRRYQEQVTCKDCQGTRLRAQSRAIQIEKASITDVLSWSIEDTLHWFEKLTLPEHKKAIASDVLKQISGRLDFLNSVGVGYLTLNRLSKTLSGGECQRIYLASQLGNKLCSTLYVLDEPSIGLHAADTDRLIQLLHRLRDHGNTVVVVEHDLDVIRSADYMIELGPQAGYQGGQVVVQGPMSDSAVRHLSLTAQYLNKDQTIEPRISKRKNKGESIRITGANENNLKDLDVTFPLHQLVAVTGLSGSGKTSLIHKTLYSALHRLFHNEKVPVGRFQRLYGTDSITDVVMLDQTPIGRTSRSNPATYLKIYDDIRKIYSNQPLAIKRGYEPKHFSFNVDGGRCTTCKGEGEVTIDMHFMAEIKLPCEQCEGKRFQKKVLDIEFKRRNISQLLATTIDECIDLFREYPAVVQKLHILKNVGLGYLQLGQSGTTLSGGESQRLKIASVLAEKSTSNVLYIFDEPTTGLHIHDIRKLLSVLHDLVDSGHSVIVVEHNLDLIAQADHVIDLGPEGGDRGGQIVATGTPAEIMANPLSITGKFLKRMTNAPH